MVSVMKVHKAVIKRRCRFTERKRSSAAKAMLIGVAEAQAAGRNSLRRTVARCPGYLADQLSRSRRSVSSAQAEALIICTSSSQARLSSAMSGCCFSRLRSCKVSIDRASKTGQAKRRHQAADLLSSERALMRFNASMGFLSANRICNLRSLTKNHWPSSSSVFSARANNRCAFGKSSFRQCKSCVASTCVDGQPRDLR